MSDTSVLLISNYISHTTLILTFKGGAVKKWTMKMFKFDSETGVLCYCDAGSYQKSNQVITMSAQILFLLIAYFI